MTRRDFLRDAGLTALALGLAAAGRGRAQAATAPNVLFIMADDLGYGDVGCYGATHVRTPNIDRLAREGMRFTDAHAPSPICTPTRYTLLTGEYYWRIGPTRGAHWNKSRKLLIQEDRFTLGELFQNAGYKTACVGKWHLGFGEERPDWNGELSPGPLDVGFDYYFGVPNANSEAPFAFVENRRIVGLDPEDPIGIPGEGEGNYHQQTGGEKARWDDENIAITQTERAVSFLEANQDKPFFLYFAPCNVHVPITPNKRFQGTSGCGLYGDFIHELDWSVGEVLNTLDRLGLTGNTLVFFTSDNGGVNHRDVRAVGHLTNGEYIGQKTDVWEGGQRVPFVARWPKHIPAGKASGELVAIVDMLATSAALLGTALPEKAGPDSFDLLPVLLDEPGHRAPRDTLVLGWPGWALRHGTWLYIPHQGSGGVTTSPDNPAGEGWMNFAELGHKNSDYDADGKLRHDAPPGQLYDLANDPAESTNLYRDYPDMVKRLDALLNGIKSQGERFVRSGPSDATE